MFRPMTDEYICEQSQPADVHKQEPLLFSDTGASAPIQAQGTHVEIPRTDDVSRPRRAESAVQQQRPYHLCGHPSQASC
eukprot:scaffold314349_cov34-Prasinocladus_malaysianus.AAC.1